MKSIIKKLEKLRLDHYICEDSWYSCPKSGDSCNEYFNGCNCGADKHNKILDQIIDKLKRSK